MLATGRREGRMLIITMVVVLFLLLAVVFWFRVPRRNLVPTTPPSRVQLHSPDRALAANGLWSASNAVHDSETALAAL
jgi:hypothetical protein